MSPKVILLVSVCFNAGLAIAYIMSPADSVQETPDSVITTKGSSASSGRKGAVDGESSPGTVTTTVDPGFHWREVEAEDYKEYIAKLRGIKCPEATIRDIIVADVDKLYEPRMMALREPSTYQPDKYWIFDQYGSSRRRDPEKAAQLKALNEERAALLKDLLGVEERDLRMAHSHYEDPNQTQYAYLPEELRDKLKQLDRKFGEERNRLYEEASGYIDSETQTALGALRKKMLEEMKGFMTPEQIFEYDIRTSDSSRNLKFELRGVELTEEEFRAVYAARRAQEDTRITGSERPTAEQVKAMQEANRLAQESMKAALGEERAREVELARDYSYRQLVNAAPFLGFDKAAALRVTDLKSESEKAANELRRNQSLSPEERNKALQEIRVAAEAAVTKEIGEKGYKYYKRQGGYWLNNLSPRVSTP